MTTCLPFLVQYPPPPFTYDTNHLQTSTHSCIVQVPILVQYNFLKRNLSCTGIHVSFHTSKHKNNTYSSQAYYKQNWEQDKDVRNSFFDKQQSEQQ